MRQRVRLVFAVCGIAIAYLLLFPQPTRTELLVEAAWAASIEQDAIRVSGGQLVPFTTPHSYGYLSEFGSVTLRGRLLHGVAMDPQHFVSYPRVPDQLILQRSNGAFEASLPGSAYPHIEAGRLFTISSNGSLLSEWNPQGGQLWSVRLPGPIGVMSAGEDYVVAGLGTGGLVAIDSAGDGKHIEVAGDSDAGIVYGIDVDSKHQQFAVLAEVDPGVITVFESREERFVPVFQRDVALAARRSAIVQFDTTGELVVYETAEGLRLTNTQTGLTAEVGLSSAVRRVVEDDAIGVFAVLGVGKMPDPSLGFRRRVSLFWITSGGTIVAAAPFAAEHVDMSTTNGYIYLTRDDRILKLRISQG